MVQNRPWKQTRMRHMPVLLVCIIAGLAFGKLTILSESHSISGSAGWPPDIESYHQSASSAVSASATGSGYYGEAVTASSAAGDFAVSAAVSNSIFSGTARAESTYLFTADCSVIDLHLAGATGMYSWDGNTIAYEMRDQTLGQTLVSYASPTSYDYESVSVDEGYRVPIAANHQYSLYLSAIASQGDAGLTHSYLNADITCVVPAPGALLLAGIGSGLVLVGLKKQRGNPI